MFHFVTVISILLFIIMMLMSVIPNSKDISFLRLKEDMDVV